LPKGEAERSAASMQGREVNVISGVVACAVIVYTDRQTDRHTDRRTNLIISSNSVRSIGGDN